MRHQKIQGNTVQAQGFAWPRRRVLQTLACWGQGAAVAGAWAQTGAKPRPHAKPSKSLEELKPEKRSFSIAVSNPSALAYLPLLVAEKRGFFAQQGLDLEIIEHQSSSRAMQAVGAGQADALCAWLENTVSPAGRALALQSYVLMGRAPMMALGVANKPGANLPSLAQLRGRMLGVVALNSPTHTLAVALLRSAGLKSGDMRFVSVGSPASAAAALRSGQIDALMHMDPLMQQLVHSGELRILADLRSPEPCEQWLGQSLPSSCLSATADFLQRYPGVALASSQAMLDALQWLARVSVRDILALLPDGLPGVETQLFVASLVNLRLAYAFDGQCSEAQLKALWQAMMEAQPTLRLERVNPLQSHTNAFVQRASLR